MNWKLYLTSATVLLALSLAACSNSEEEPQIESASQTDLISSLKQYDTSIMENLDFPEDLDHRDIKTYYDLKTYRPGVFAPRFPTFIQLWFDDAQTPEYRYLRHDRAFPVAANGTSAEIQELFFTDNNGNDYYKYHIEQIIKISGGESVIFRDFDNIPGLTVGEKEPGNFKIDFSKNKSGKGIFWIFELKSDMQVEFENPYTLKPMFRDYQRDQNIFYQLAEGEEFDIDILTEPDFEWPDDSEYIKEILKVSEYLK